MSRIARKPLEIPNGVEFKINGQEVFIKGKKGEFKHHLDSNVVVEIQGNSVQVKPANKRHAMVGTTRKLLGNFVKGVNEGFEKKLVLVGVGYRAKVQGNDLELSLGYSNPVKYPIPKGISIDVPSNTEITIKGIDVQTVGEIAAKIREVRPPEPYKGKGVRYLDEVVNIKETKKK